MKSIAGLVLFMALGLFSCTDKGTADDATYEQLGQMDQVLDQNATEGDDGDVKSDPNT
jgi:hypothetical protein